ncbi:MAG: hypothetical protein A2046_03360 [Bacteroidetes bacterium GWA2_30_7]|nr:MAG: hypothetical protein A2046_03360 [Bacteroidetes bacterium GWA2_30_7]
MKSNYVLCDTNIFIHLFINDKATIEKLTLIGSQNILMPAITKMELYKGMSNKKELAEMKKKISNYSVLKFNEDVSKIAIELIEKYHLSNSLKIPDAIIAASALAFDLPLFTYNLKDFKGLEGIKLYNF